MAGIGLGMLVGFFISVNLSASSSFVDDRWFREELMSVAYGASTLLFGGIGLIIAFIIETKMGKEKK